MARVNLDGLPSLASERLRLRRPVRADADAVHTLANNWEVARWMSRLPYPYSRDDAVFFMEEIVPHEVAWAIEDRRNGYVMGIVGLTPHETGAELGYWLGEPYWRRGFASEAARTVLDHAFGALGLSCVTSGCFAGNARSARVLAKLGFRQVGTSTRSCLAQDRELQHLDMAISHDAWLERAGGAG